MAVITGERGQREIVRPLAAVGVPCVVLDWEELRARSRWPYLRFIAQVWALTGAHRGATVFTDMNSAFLAVIVLAAKLRRGRLLLRLRGDPFAETRDQIQFFAAQCRWVDLSRALVAALLDQRLFHAVDCFVPVSHWVVQRLGIQSRSRVVRLAIDVAAFSPRVHGPSVPLRLLAVTNFDFPTKVAALGRFLDAHGKWLRAQGCEVIIAGSGFAWRSFQTRHDAQAQFPGFVRDVGALYATADLFIHFSDLDAFPYVVLEAQAAGLPVIVNADCGMLEQIEDGVTGFIVNLGDAANVQSVISKLQREPQLRAQIGAAARAHIAANYSLPQIAKALAEVCA